MKDMGLKPLGAYSITCQCGKVDDPSKPGLINITVTLHHITQRLWPWQNTALAWVLLNISILATKSRCQDQFITKATDQAPCE
jgi:hypothetical protein